MFLVAGPTGSGKTTTLYALIHELELSSQAVVTVEDPVEYPVDGITQIEVNIPLGLTFAVGLKAMLRLDPDYLLVGEIRDAESAQIAVEAAATGHCVMSTLHSPDTAGVVILLRNWGIRDHQIANVLQIALNQRLVGRLCQKCRQRDAPSKTEGLWLKALELPVIEGVYRAAGCAACQYTGYYGRIGVFEVWQKDDSDYELILSHADEQTLRRHLRKRGLQTVLEDGLARVQEGVTMLSELQTMGALPC
jgi:type II secretory ATPase GspE/PulE/Tfp pilus assembly ATPase PilB-like protein